MTTLDDVLDRQRAADALGRCTDKGVTERPPVAGFSYAAFAVHPRSENLLALAIAHRAGEKFVVDLVREEISVAAASAILKCYGVSEVAGAEDVYGLPLAQAVMGVVSVLGRQ
jgi:hypothetical protein